MEYKMTETMAMVAIMEAVDELKAKGFQVYVSTSIHMNLFFTTVFVSLEGCPIEHDSSMRFMCCGLKEVERVVCQLSKLAGIE